MTYRSVGRTVMSISLGVVLGVVLVGVSNVQREETDKGIVAGVTLGFAAGGLLLGFLMECVGLVESIKAKRINAAKADAPKD